MIRLLGQALSEVPPKLEDGERSDQDYAAELELTHPVKEDFQHIVDPVYHDLQLKFIQLSVLTEVTNVQVLIVQAVIDAKTHQSETEIGHENHHAQRHYKPRVSPLDQQYADNQHE